MFQKFNILLLLVFFWSISLAQNPTKSVKFLNSIDSIYDDNLAFKKLDSLLKTNTLKGKYILKAKEKIVLRSLTLQKYEVLNQNCYEGIELAKNLKNDSAQAFFQKLLAFPYYYHKDYKKAIAACKKSLAILKGKNYPEIEASLYNNMGGTYIDMHELGLGEKMLLKSLEVHEKANLNQIHTYFLTKRILGSLYSRQKKYKEALSQYTEVLDFAVSKKDTHLISSALIFRSSLFNLTGDINQALKDSQYATDLMEKYGDQHSLLANYIFHSSNLYKAGRYKEAYLISSKLYNMSGKIYNEETQLQLNELETKYKTKEIQEKNALEKAKNATLKKQNQLYISLVFVIVSLVIVSILVFYILSQRKKIKLQQFIQSQRLEAIIEGEEKEKSRLASELHDGIVQELTVLNLQLSHFTAQLSKEEDFELRKIINKLKSTTNEVRGISYQLMPVTLKELGLQNAIEDLFERSFLALEIDFEILVHDLPQSIPERLEITVFRICQELINNTIKHSKATFVSLLIHSKNDNLHVLYEDNGIGFIVSDVKHGIGLTSLYSRADLINAELKIDSELKAGTHVFLKIPLNT